MTSQNGTGQRVRRYGEGVRIRLPPEAGPRVERLAARAYRSESDQLRYLVMLGLEVEEQRQAAADSAMSVVGGPKLTAGGA